MASIIQDRIYTHPWDTPGFITMAKHNFLQKTAIFLLGTLCDQLWGFRPNLIPTFVAQKGWLGALLWFARNMPRYERIRDRWGPIRTHLLATEISLLNGCTYCANGHAYALQLHYLRQTEWLFPLSESEILALQSLPEAEQIDRLEAALAEAGLSSAILDLRRLVELYEQPALAVTDKDRDMLQLIRMFADLNDCGRKYNLQIDQAHDPINKRREWRDRYAALRRAEPAQPVVVPEPAITVLNPSDLYL
ncbi:MAG: hypothetical protein AAFO83_05025 [Cyanobacteria bacterium J06607_13]